MTFDKKTIEVVEFDDDELETLNNAKGIFDDITSYVEFNKYDRMRGKRFTFNIDELNTTYSVLVELVAAIKEGGIYLEDY